jgi:streptomycin 6-kinase
VRRRRSRHGDAGGTVELSDDRPDLAALERIAREVAEEWGVELGERFAFARYSFVAAVGDDAVLKVTPPADDEADEEGDALELWDGEGAVRLLRRDRARRALLVERARPGDDISELPDDQATAVAVAVGLKLWRPAAEPFRWIGDQLPRWLDHAEGHELLPLARELHASRDIGRETLVHGDFHHHNILRSGRGHLAIDPKPMLGEPEYDVATILWNPLPHKMEPASSESRLAAFAAAGLRQERMRAWAVIRGACLGADENESAVLRALV